MSPQSLKLTIIIEGMAIRTKITCLSVLAHKDTTQLLRATGNTGPWEQKKKGKKVHLHFSLHAAKAPTIALISPKIISAVYVFCRLMHRINFLLEEAILP